MQKIKTQSGFTWQIDEETMDDIRFFDLLIKHDEGNRVEQIASISELIEVLIGEEERKKLYKHLINKEGRPKISTLEAEINEVFEKFGKRKKK